MNLNFAARNRQPPVPTALISSSPSVDFHLRTYKKQAHQIKKKKLWSAFKYNKAFHCKKKKTQYFYVHLAKKNAKILNLSFFFCANYGILILMYFSKQSISLNQKQLMKQVSSLSHLLKYSKSVSVKFYDKNIYANNIYAKNTWTKNGVRAT